MVHLPMTRIAPVVLIRREVTGVIEVHNIEIVEQGFSLLHGIRGYVSGMRTDKALN